MSFKQYLNSIVSELLVGLSEIIVFSFIMAIPLHFLWNAVVPQIFGLPQIGVIDGALLYMLSGIFLSLAK